MLSTIFGFSSFTMLFAMLMAFKATDAKSLFIIIGYFVLFCTSLYSFFAIMKRISNMGKPIKENAIEL